MTATSAAPVQHVRVALARVQQLIGWAGIAGVALLVAAVIVTALAWSAQKAFVRANATRSPVVAPQPMTATVMAEAVAPPTPELPPASDIPLLLTQMKQAAVSNGLDWRAAAYRITAATPTQPASLEVRCSIRGAYPKLRSMLVQLQTSIPAFTVREFSANRPNADTPDVEAKLALAVLLQDGTLASDVPETASKATP